MPTVDHKIMCNYCICARPKKDFACIFESEEKRVTFYSEKYVHI